MTGDLSTLPSDTPLEKSSAAVAGGYSIVFARRFVATHPTQRVQLVFHYRLFRYFEYTIINKTLSNLKKKPTMTKQYQISLIKINFIVMLTTSALFFKYVHTKCFFIQWFNQFLVKRSASCKFA